MNRIFSLPRLGLLFKQDAMENYRKLLLSTGVLFAVLAMVGIYADYLCRHVYDQATFDHSVTTTMRVWYILIFFIAGAFAGASLFPSFRTKPGRIATLMTPASQAEKFIERWLVVVPLYIVAYVVIASIAEWVRVEAAGWFVDYKASFLDIGEIFNGQFSTAKKLSIALIGFLCTQSFFILGGQIWNRMAVAKTFGSIVLIGLIYIGIGAWIVDTFIESDMRYDFPLDWNPVDVTCIVMVVITIFNYAVSYLRFRESEVINRW